MEDQLPGGTGAGAAGGEAKGSEALRRQLCWRDFYQHVLVHHPENARQEFQPRYRGTLAWAGGDAEFTAWTEGRTGFPLVDAGMRQLRREGWMHNRVRLLVGSFLTKDLGIDWRRGEDWFMRLLLDGDQASNNGNWQWIASVGVDPQPAFRRIYNPSLQQERFDPDGRYVRRYVPELARVPDEYLAEPWRMPAEVQEQAGCRIGRDYPGPIVDHKAARQAALDRYRDATDLTPGFLSPAPAAGCGGPFRGAGRNWAANPPIRGRSGTERRSGGKIPEKLLALSGTRTPTCAGACAGLREGTRPWIQ